MRSGSEEGTSSLLGVILVGAYRGVLVVKRCFLSISPHGQQRGVGFRRIFWQGLSATVVRYYFVSSFRIACSSRRRVAVVLG
jgi:hypothetical protein